MYINFLLFIPDEIGSKSSDRKIEVLQEEIKNLSSKTADGKDSLSWPIGVNPPFQVILFL